MNPEWFFAGVLLVVAAAITWVHGLSMLTIASYMLLAMIALFLHLALEESK